MDNISTDQLKMVITKTGSDVGILMSILVSHLQKVGACTVIEISRYLFKNIEFEKCFSNSRYSNIAKKLFGILTDNCNDDFKCAVEWIVKCIKTLKNRRYRSQNYGFISVSNYGTCSLRGLASS